MLQVWLTKQMIKRGTVKEQLSVDSVSRKMGGSCPLMPEEVSLFIIVSYIGSLNMDGTVHQSYTD